MTFFPSLRKIANFYSFHLMKRKLDFFLKYCQCCAEMWWKKKITKSVQKNISRDNSEARENDITRERGKLIHWTFVLLPSVENTLLFLFGARTQKNFNVLCICVCGYLIMNGKRKAEMLHEKHLNGNNNKKKLVCTYYYISAAKSLIKWNVSSIDLTT